MPFLIFTLVRKHPHRYDFVMSFPAKNETKRGPVESDPTRMLALPPASSKKEIGGLLRKGGGSDRFVSSFVSGGWS